MLEQHFTYTPGGVESEDEKGFGLRLKRDHSWKNSKFRLLIIMQTVSRADLKAKTLASTPALANCIKYGRQLAREVRPNIPDFSYAVINFNDAKSLHLRGTARAGADNEFRTRCLALVDTLDPTHILYSGSVSKLYPEIDHCEDKNGWVHSIQGRKVTSTLDFSQLVDDDGQYANCLGYWCRHIANLMIGRHPYSVRDIVNKPRYIDTIEKFDKMMTLFNDAKEVALDTEDRNLSVYHNKLYTVQLCFDKHPNLGFVVPIDHPRTPFSREEIAYIKKALRRQIDRKDLLFLMFNGKFDLRVLRVALKMKIIKSRVWEITAGEHLLDENVSSLPSIGIKGGNLRAVLCSYDNDHYYTAEFGKDERGSIGAHDPSDLKVLDYESMDVVCLHAIKAKQIERANRMKIGEKDYGPYFVNHMIYQMSDTEHQLSHLKQDGSYISRKYLKSLMAAGSPLRKEIDAIIQDFYETPAVQEANKRLLEASGFKAGNLFNKDKAQWVFNLNKPDHKKVLFLDVLELEAISKTATGAPAIDKSFITYYKDKNLIVAKYGLYQEAAKLLSTYVKGWYRRIVTDLDSADDSHLRPDYSYFDVDTGRLASKNPNLQNIPARGKLAKIIKRMFEAPEGYLLVRFDYSAHEVRGWSIVSGDQELADVFRMGQKLRQEWIQNPCDETKAAIKKDGDVHLLNVKRFFNKIVDKSHPLRDAVKAVVFGVIYGKGAKTLGDDTKKAEIDELRAKLNVLYAEKRNPETLKARRSKISSEIDPIEHRLITLLAEDRSEYAQGIIDKLFNEFKRGHRWIQRMSKLAEEKFYVYSPIGRIRHLFAAITGDKAVVAKQVRRGTNAPIQGFASEIGTKASRRVIQSYYELAPKLVPLLGLDKFYDYRIKFNRVVHDALYFSVPYAMVIPFIHVLQYEATYGVTKAYEEEFGIKFTIEPEIEIEVSSRDDHTFKWDWSTMNLVENVKLALTDQQELGKLEDIPDTMSMVFGPWANRKVRSVLQDRFPLLGIKDLDAQIKKAVVLSTAV